MAEQYSRDVLKVTVAQIAHHLGWTSIHSTPLELLTDILERYILQTSNYAHRYSEQFGRTNPNLDDVGLSFQEMGVNLNELNDYVKSMEVLSQPAETPQFPAPKSNELNFPKPKSKELLEREEHVDEHLPPMHPEWNVEEVIPTTPTMPMPGQFYQNGEEIPSIVSPNMSNTSGPEKRPFSSPTEGMPAPKKLRTMSSLPEEAQPSQYELKGVRITHGGYLAPTQPGYGKLPDSRTPPPPTPTTVVNTPPLHAISNLSSFKSDNGSDDDALIRIDDSPSEDDVRVPHSEKPVPKLKTSSKLDKLAKSPKPPGLKIKKPSLKIPKSPKGSKSPRPKSPRSPGRSPIRKSPKVSKPKIKHDEYTFKDTVPDMPKKIKKKHLKTPGQTSTPKAPSSISFFKKNLDIEMMPSPVRVESPALTISFDEKRERVHHVKKSSYDDIINSVAACPSVHSSPGPSGAGTPHKSDVETDSDEILLMDAVNPDIDRLRADFEGRQRELTQKKKEWRVELEKLREIEEQQEKPAVVAPVEAPPKVDNTSEKRERDKRIESTIDDVIANFVPEVPETIEEEEPPPVPLKSPLVPFVPAPVDPYSFNEPEISPFSPVHTIPPDPTKHRPSIFDFEPPAIGKIASPKERKSSAKEGKSKEKREKKERKEKKKKSSVSDFDSISDRDHPGYRDIEKTPQPFLEKKTVVISKAKAEPSAFHFPDVSPKKSPKKSPKITPLTLETSSPKIGSPPQPAIKKLKITGLGGGPSVSLSISHSEKDSKEKEHHKKEKKKKKNKDKDKERDKDKKKHKDKDKKKDKKDKKEKKHKEDSLTIPKLKFKFGGGGSNPSVSVSEKKEPLKLKIKPFSPMPERSPARATVTTETMRTETVMASPIPNSPTPPIESPARRSPSPVASPAGRVSPGISGSASPYDLSLSPAKRSMSSRSPSPVARSQSSPDISPYRSPSPPRISPSPVTAESVKSQSPFHETSPQRERSPFRLTSRSPSPVGHVSTQEQNASHVPTWSPAGSPRWSPTHIPTLESPSSSPRRSPTRSRSPSVHRSRSPVLMTKSWLNSPARKSPSPPRRQYSPTPPPMTPAARTPSPSPPPDSPRLEIDGVSDDDDADASGEMARTVITETVGTTMDDNGDVVWICPSCKMPDDGSPMIGCDGEHCDDWYHWPCVGVTSEPPEWEKWYCPKCKARVKTKAARKKRPAPKRGGKGKKKMGL